MKNKTAVMGRRCISTIVPELLQENRKDCVKNNFYIAYK